MTNHIDLANRAINDGGFTYSFESDSFPSEGFAVGVCKGLEVKIPVDLFTYRDLAAFVHQNAKHLIIPRMALGCWLDDGVVYIDVSMVVATHEEAVELCKQHDQIAFYDLARGETVRLKDVLEQAA